MNIERKILFFPLSEKWGGKGEKITTTNRLQKEVVYNATGKLRMRVRWKREKNYTVDFNLGFRVYHSKWIKEAQTCKANTTHPKGATAYTINQKCSEYQNVIEGVFKHFEVKNVIPTQDELRDEFNATLKRKTDTLQPVTFFDFFDVFVKERGSQNDWTPATFTKFSAVKNHLTAFNKELSFDLLDEAILSEYVQFLRNDKKMLNSTIKKQLGYLKWFLNWADTKHLITIDDYKSFNPKLKQVDNDVVYLTKEELTDLRAYKIPESKQYLERVRDVFLFGCNTALRYSDIRNLSRNHIVGDMLTIVTQKTDDKLKIKLTATAQQILAKYENVPFEDNKALPTISNQKMNDYLKELCKLTEIDTLITKVHFKGNERIEHSYPKHELIGTHTARRTFICNALLSGMPAHAVMKITGHSDYKAMQPYISIVSKEVDNFMDKLNF